ncbi:MAG: hypothetical protein OEY75_05925 [Hylemonella sp.]|nr:hypothetical protein [Hylemonella sp.]MDH5708634.1 hypothetical protein [Hylemonella sp.]
MPYYIYRVKPLAGLRKLTEHDAFAPASAEAKQLRAGLEADSRDKIKVIFADNELMAEDLLSQVREPRPAGDE